MSRWVNNIVALLFCISLTMCPGSNVTHSECQNAIVYTAIEDGRSDIFLNDMCNGMYRQITYNAASWMPVFSPRGDEIVYERTFGVTDHIFIHSTQIPSIEDLELSETLARGRFPAWSPDGSFVSFAGQQEDTDNFQIYVVDRDGTGLRRLIQDVAIESGDATYSAWSPNGSQLAFIAHHGENSHSIYISNVDGTGLMEIPTPGYLQDYLSWHPNGESIAFTSNTSNHSFYDVYVLRLEDQTVERITSGHDSRKPVWSPNGAAIAFAAFVDHQFQIVLLDAAQPEQQTQLTAEGSNHSPVWSFDGESIAFVSDRDGYWNIYVMDADGTNVTRLTDNSQNYVDPSWFGS